MDPHPIARPFIVQAGRTTQALGHGRVVGQLYAYLYFSEEPRCLSDMQDALGISKGSASTAIRVLEDWGAAKRLWLKGDRRDFFEARTSFAQIIRRALATTIAATMSTTDKLIDSAIAEVDETDDAFIHERLVSLESFRDRAAEIQNNPILKRLLGF